VAVPAAGWVGLVHPEITSPSNFHQLRDTTLLLENGFDRRAHWFSGVLRSGRTGLPGQ